MVGLDQLDLKVLNVHINLVNLKEVLAVLIVGGRQLQAEAEPIAGHLDVSNTSVRDGREALLAFDIEANIAQIHLDTGDFDVDRVPVGARNLLAAPTEVVVAGDFEDVGHEVVALQNQILNDSIYLGIRVLDAGDGNVCDPLEGSRDDDLCQVLKEMRLEDCLAIFVLTEVGE